MSGIFIILIFLSLFGFLPFLIILLRRRMAKKILTTGMPAKARVYRVLLHSRSAVETVSYTYYGNDGKQYYGSFTGNAGLHNMDDIIDVFFDPSNPKRSTVTGAWGSPVLLAFGLAIGLFVLFAVYKIYGMWQRGEV